MYVLFSLKYESILYVLQVMEGPMNHPARTSGVPIAVVGPNTPTRFIPSRVRRSLTYGGGTLTFVSPNSSPVYSRRIFDIPEDSEPEDVGGDDAAEDEAVSEVEGFSTDWYPAYHSAAFFIVKIKNYASQIAIFEISNKIKKSTKVFILVGKKFIFIYCVVIFWRIELKNDNTVFRSEVLEYYPKSLRHSGKIE